MTNKKLIVFQDKNIRRIWHKEEWHFSVVDVVGVLTESSIPKRYWTDLKRKLIIEGSEVYDNIVQLKMESSDGKLYLTDCANIKSIFRIIQSIPSKKAEPFKLWLAKVGSDRIDEIDNPALAQERMKEIYEKKGYSKDWIDKRLRGIAIRQNLTEEWKNRGVEENIEFAILTNEISKATFGKTVEEYKKLKGLNKENLRDHMGDLELIFTMLGERVSTEITINKDSQGFEECEVAAQQGGEVAGNARKEAEEKIGESIVSDRNYILDEQKGKQEKEKLVIKK